MAITTNPFKRQPMASEMNYSNPRRSMPRTGFGGDPNRPITGSGRPGYNSGNSQISPTQPPPGLPSGATNPTQPQLPVFTGPGINVSAGGGPTTQPGIVPLLVTPRPWQRPIQRPSKPGYAQNPTQSVFQGQMQGSGPGGGYNGPSFNPLGSQSYDQRSMVGGNTAGAGASNPWGFDQAARGALDRQNAIMGLFNQARQGLAPMQAALMNDYQNPQGLGNETMQAMKRQGDVQNAFAMARMQQDARQKLGASGFAGSPAAALVDAGIRGAATRGDIDRNAALTMQDSAMRNENRQFAMQQLAGLLGLDLSSAVGMGENIGRMQTPYLTPEGAAAAGATGGSNPLMATAGAFPGTATAAGGFSGPASWMQGKGGGWNGSPYAPTAQQFRELDAEQLRALRRMDEMSKATLGNPWQMIRF